MKKVPTGVLKTLAGLVGRLSPAAKAIAAAVLPLATAVGNWVISGQFNAASIETAALAAATGLAVYLVPNKAKASRVKP